MRFLLWLLSYIGLIPLGKRPSWVGEHHRASNILLPFLWLMLLFLVDLIDVCCCCWRSLFVYFCQVVSAVVVWWFASVVVVIVAVALYVLASSLLQTFCSCGSCCCWFHCCFVCVCSCFWWIWLFRLCLAPMIQWVIFGFWLVSCCSWSGLCSEAAFLLALVSQSLNNCTFRNRILACSRPPSARTLLQLTCRLCFVTKTETSCCFSKADNEATLKMIERPTSVCKCCSVVASLSLQFAVATPESLLETSISMALCVWAAFRRHLPKRYGETGFCRVLRCLGWNNAVVVWAGPCWILMFEKFQDVWKLPNEKGPQKHRKHDLSRQSLTLGNGLNIVLRTLGSIGVKDHCISQQTKEENSNLFLSFFDLFTRILALFCCCRRSFVCLCVWCCFGCGCWCRHRCCCLWWCFVVLCCCYVHHVGQLVATIMLFLSCSYLFSSWLVSTCNGCLVVLVFVVVRGCYCEVSFGEALCLQWFRVFLSVAVVVAVCLFPCLCIGKLVTIDLSLICSSLVLVWLIDWLIYWVFDWLTILYLLF